MMDCNCAGGPQPWHSVYSPGCVHQPHDPDKAYRAHLASIPTDRYYNDQAILLYKNGDGGVMYIGTLRSPAWANDISTMLNRIIREKENYEGQATGHSQH